MLALSWKSGCDRPIDAVNAIPQSKTAWAGWIAYSSIYDFRLNFGFQPLDLGPVSTQE